MSLKSKLKKPAIFSQKLGVQKDQDTTILKNEDSMSLKEVVHQQL